MGFLADLHSAPLSFVAVLALSVGAVAVEFLPIPRRRISHAVGAFLWIAAAEILCGYFIVPFWFYRVALPIGGLLWSGYVLWLWRRGSGAQPAVLPPTPPRPRTGVDAQDRSRVGGKGWKIENQDTAIKAGEDAEVDVDDLEIR